MDKNSRITLLIVILVSTGLLWFAAAKMSFWEDETYTSSQSQKTIPVILEGFQSDVHPVLPLIFTSLWGSIFGYDEPGLRSLSIIFSGLSLWAVFFLAKDLFDRKTAFLAVMILAFMPLFIMFGHQARYYPMAMLFSVMLALMFRYYLQQHKIVYLIVYVLFACLLIYVSYSAFSVIVAANLWWIIDWFRKSVRDKRYFYSWVTAQAGILLFSFPLISHIQSLVERYYAAPNFGFWPVEALKRGLYLVYTYAVGQTISPLNPIAWIGCLVVGFLVILAFVKQKSRPSFWFLATFLIVVVVINLVVSLTSGWLSQIWQNLPHWSFYAIPFWAILLASGIDKLRLRWQGVVMFVLLLVFSAANLNYYVGRQFIQPIYAVPWKEIFENIHEEASSNMALVCSGSDVACRYYAGRYGLDQNLYSNERQIPFAQADQVWWIQIYLGQER
ncbi:MAG TPA: glycosyltransferase family 39 protein, partial [Bellilinea sp.]|nr:glycosyltransferase family 39 protein [Bellilinea sp.]